MLFLEGFRVSNLAQEEDDADDRFGDRSTSTTAACCCFDAAREDGREGGPRPFDPLELARAIKGEGDGVACSSSSVALSTGIPGLVLNLAGSCPPEKVGCKLWARRLLPLLTVHRVVFLDGVLLMRLLAVVLSVVAAAKLLRANVTLGVSCCRVGELDCLVSPLGEKVEGSGNTVKAI